MISIINSFKLSESIENKSQEEINKIREETKIVTSTINKEVTKKVEHYISLGYMSKE